MGVFLSEFTGAQLDAYMNYAKDLGATHNDDYHTGSAQRAEALGVAGLDASNVGLAVHRDVCLQEFYLNGKQLGLTDYRDDDMWNIMALSPASSAYATRVLTLKSGTGAITAGRVGIPYALSMTDHFLEVTFGYAGYVNGEGGQRNNFLGFASSLATFPTTQCIGFSRDNTNDISYIVYGSTALQTVALTTLPIGRNLQATDFITIRLYTSEAGTAINTANFYINGALQFTTTSIPTVSVYSGFGVYNVDDAVTTQSELGINYFSFKRMI